MRTNHIGVFRPVNDNLSDRGDKAATRCRTPPTPAGQSKARLKGQAVKLTAFRQLPSGAKAVLEALWELADTPRGWDPWVHGRAKVRTIARYAGLSDRQAQRWLGRLRVVEPGQDAPAGHLGGWIDTNVVAGRFLAFTVYAEPSQSTAETVTEDAEVLSEPSPMSEEVGHPCPTDIPPVLSTSTTTKATANAEALPEAGPDHGGGGDGDINEAQAQRTADNRDRVRQFLTDAGCRAGDVDRLAHAVLSEPDGPERMAKTYRGLEGNVGSPIAVLVHRIRNGTLDELDKADRRRGALDTLADDIASRGYRKLNDWLADMTAKIEDTPGVRIPVPLQNLLGLNGSAALDSERQRVSDKDPERRRRWLAGMELEVVRSLSAASGKDAVAA